MDIRLIALVAASAVLAACGGGDKTEPATNVRTDVETTQTPDGTDPAAAETLPARMEDETIPDNTVIEVNTDALTAVANIDGAITAFSPELSARIQSDIEMALESAKAVAEQEAGEDYFMAHDYQYDYVKSASVGDIISVEFMEMVYTGGAHPNYVIGGILYDRATDADIPSLSLLTEEGKAQVKTLLMEKLAAQKMQRMSMGPEDLSAIEKDVADIFPKEDEFWFGEITLVPSKGEAGTFGGLVVHYSPYDVGSYAEGAYDILVSASELEGLLAEPYAAMFGGEPDYNDAREP